MQAQVEAGLAVWQGHELAAGFAGQGLQDLSKCALCRQGLATEL